jgi:cardiolipin synthase A/B
VDGGTFFPAMLGSIAVAKSHILLEMYLFESGQTADRFIDALSAAAGRGVKVFVLLDHFGAFYLRRRDRERLAESGVELASFNRLRFGRRLLNLPRNHRKLLLVDGEVAFTGGVGITDQFDPAAFPNSYWHEIMVEIRGPCVLDWQSVFKETWERSCDRPLDLPQGPARKGRGSRPGRVVLHARAAAKSEISRSFINRVRHAERRIWLATAYFVPSWKLRRALRRAARLGVDVRLLLPGPRTDHPSVRILGRRYYGRLLRDGVRVFEYQPRFLHAKVLLVDDWLSIGSSNLDHWNHRWNLEANQELEDPVLVEKVRSLFVSDFAKSREIGLREWRERPRLERLMERLFGWIFSLAARIREGRPPGERQP